MVCACRWSAATSNRQLSRGLASHARIRPGSVTIERGSPHPGGRQPSHGRRLAPRRRRAPDVDLESCPGSERMHVLARTGQAGPAAGEPPFANSGTSLIGPRLSPTADPKARMNPKRLKHEPPKDADSVEFGARGRFWSNCGAVVPAWRGQPKLGRGIDPRNVLGRCVSQVAEAGSPEPRNPSRTGPP